jgi:hypothetical protein
MIIWIAYTEKVLLAADTNATYVKLIANSEEGSKVISLAIPQATNFFEDLNDLLNALLDEFEDSADWKDAKRPIQIMAQRVKDQL